MTKQIETGGPAFPAEVSYDSDLAVDHQIGHNAYRTVGMTLRDYFAAKAMQSYIAQLERSFKRMDDVAKWSYEMSDAMLAVRGGK